MQTKTLIKLDSIVTLVEHSVHVRVSTFEVFLTSHYQGCQMVVISNQKSQFGWILEGLGMENDGIFYGRLEYVFYGHVLYFMAPW
jgi:hypothetical protein